MTILEILYASTAFIALISFMPQMARLWRDNSGAESISISAVSMWTFISAVSLIYALHVNGDLLFIFGTAVFTAGNGAILSLALYSRYFKKVSMQSKV